MERFIIGCLGVVCCGIGALCPTIMLIPVSRHCNINWDTVEGDGFGFTTIAFTVLFFIAGAVCFISLAAMAEKDKPGGDC